jgi:hypothetical protein
LRSDNFDSVGELYTEHDFRQLVVTIKATLAFLGGLFGELEDHCKRSLVGETSLGARRAVANRRERAFDGSTVPHWTTGARGLASKLANGLRQ